MLNQKGSGRGDCPGCAEQLGAALPRFV